jgi:hypothetical protein
MRRKFAVVTAVAIAVSALVSRGAEPDREGLEFFEKKIRPVLIDSCYKCHSAETNSSGGFRESGDIKIWDLRT